MTATNSRCACGRGPIVTEVQSGWDPDTNRGVYTPLCEACYDETEEAATHRHNRRVLEACRRLGVRTDRGPIVLEGYGRHPHADEILAAM